MTDSKPHADYKPDIELVGKIVRVTHAGTGGKSEPRKFAVMLADACDKYNVHRVLLDERKLRYDVENTEDLIQLGDRLLDDMLVFRFHRMAVVASVNQLRLAKEFESIARNRGMNYRAFDSIEAAEAWLLEDA